VVVRRVVPSSPPTRPGLYRDKDGVVALFFLPPDSPPGFQSPLSILHSPASSLQQGRRRGDRPGQPTVYRPLDFFLARSSLGIGILAPS